MGTQGQRRLQRGRAACRRAFFFFQAEDGIRDLIVTGVQTCALPISAVRCEARDVLAKEPNGAGVALQIAGNQVEQRCLAGAVWPDDEAPLARQHLERDIEYRRQPAEGLLQPRDGEGCCHWAFPRAAFTRAVSRRTPETAPSGM